MKDKGLMIMDLNIADKGYKIQYKINDTGCKMQYTGYICKGFKERGWTTITQV